MDAAEHALISDLLRDERLAGARGPEDELDADWARAVDRSRHERAPAPLSAVTRPARASGRGR